MDLNNSSEIPLYISLTFYAVVIATFSFLFYAIKRATKEPKDFTPTIVSTFIIVLLFITAILSLNKFFSNFDSLPPRLPILLMIELIAISSLFFFKRSKEFIKKMPITTLTYIHIIRVPVELVLWWLYKEGIIDPILTFEGNNFDIIVGISAPFAGLFLVGLRSKSVFSAIIWNIASLFLLFNIIYHAISCAPYPIQTNCLEIPNTIIFEFPYIWLPTFIVPIVIFCHFASIYNLYHTKDTGFK